jgi:hypothetical protein
MNKEKLERIFGAVGLQPVSREKAGDYEIFFGEGFSPAPHLRWQQRGEIEPGEFPNGAFVTFWWIGKDETLFFGRPLFFDAIDTFQTTRLATARKDALGRLKKVARADGGTTH